MDTQKEIKTTEIKNKKTTKKRIFEATRLNSILKI